VETQNEAGTQPALEEQGTLAVSADDFSALEERVKRAVDLVKQERKARAEAEARAQKAEEMLNMQLPAMAQLQSDISALRAERDQVRQRVDRLLKQLDALEL
jgi:septal ring factor EnvC (AmiA/AmiB activator)